MTPQDRRISELIDKWLTSVDLHLQYLELSDAAYARAQPWPKHDRPTRWVLDVARQKIIELKAHCETRAAMGDAKFSESLELMAFLANLVGIQHIQRFIPLADANREDKLAATNIEAPTVIRPLGSRAASSSEDSTREMPKLRPAPASAATAPILIPTPRKTPPKITTAPPKGSRAQGQATAKSASEPAPPGDINAKIIADAIRLLKWGKPWHELAELIGRIADRPPVAEIRKVLRAHKTEIENKADKSA